MSSIKFNYLTKEIELEGSESFIESNFDKIKDLMMNSFGVKREMVSRMTEIKQEPIMDVKVKESQADVEIKGHELSEASQYVNSNKIPHHLNFLMKSGLIDHRSGNIFGKWEFPVKKGSWLKLPSRNRRQSR